MMHEKIAVSAALSSTGLLAPDYRVVILGAGRGVHGDLPSAVSPVNHHGCVLDWIISAFAQLPDAEIRFVGGYRADVVMERYRDIHFHYNRDWEITGPARSLAIAPLTCGVATYVSYADVVYRGDTVRRLEESWGDAVLAIDGNWQRRYEGRSLSEQDAAEKVVCCGRGVTRIGKDVARGQATAEFAGVLKLSATAAALLEERLGQGTISDAAGIPEIVSLLLGEGMTVNAVEVHGQWAELNAAQDLARFVLGTKAESLERLKPLVRRGHIGELVAFEQQQWARDREEVLERITDVFQSGRVIVRSSALAEDCWASSSAGAFTSVPDVAVEDKAELVAAIENVIASYGKSCGQDQVLVQEMLHGVTMSGVAMTRTLALGAPYYVINYDNVSSRTDTVTSGAGSQLRTLYIHRNGKPPEDSPQEVDGLIEVLKELEGLVGHDSLDVEFAFTSEGLAHILQVRPIAVEKPDQPVNDAEIARGIADARRFFAELQKPSPWLVGKRTRLSVMADWNPAEIIGTKPGRLAFSLYRHLITDEVWAQQRAEYGYRDVRPCSLLVDVLGHPYIDVRATFNSFVPAELPDELAGHLVDYYVDELAKKPHLHDKVEFDILVTCLAFDFEIHATRLLHVGFSKSDVDVLRESLRRITKAGVHRCADDLQELESCCIRCDRILAGEYEPLERAYLLLEDARLGSVRLFAHLARGAFVAMSLLRSLATMEITSNEQNEQFLASLATVSSRMQQDAVAVAKGELAWHDFVERYGHLRPGTYDIMSPHYAADAENYLRPVVSAASGGFTPTESHRPAIAWDPGTRRRIDEALARLDIGIDSVGLEQFLRMAIEGREYGKFVFTRNLSESLEAVAELGRMHGVSRAELAHIRLQELMALRAAHADDVGEHLKHLAARGRQAAYVSQAVALPSQVESADDYLGFLQDRSEPNYVTAKRVRAFVRRISREVGPSLSLEGVIVLIPSADPGFDWIFARGIAGLITMYGGANSHMAIRAAEFGLPAAIGVGEACYEAIAGAEMLELDCAGRQIREVH